MIHVGIIGAEGAKFTKHGERQARAIIRTILARPDTVLVSGGCHLGGIDIWAEEEYANYRALQHRPDPIIHLPAVLNWSRGFKPRNLRIARDSNEVHNITVARYASGYKGMRFDECYHCIRMRKEIGRATLEHIKSGGCWTAYEAVKLDKPTYWHVVVNGEEP